MKLVAGVGVNDAEYPVTRWGIVDGKRKLLWRCPIYTLWHNMLHRCGKDRSNVYNDVTVCEEWKVFSNFKKWVEVQDYHGKTLDKDIIDPWNRVYCPEKCLLVTQRVNTLVIERRKNNSDTPNVTPNKGGTFRAYVGTGTKVKYSGLFTSLESANAWWLSVKRSLIEGLDVSDFIKERLRFRYDYFEENGKFPG